MALAETFIQLALRYTNAATAKKMWDEIALAYSHKNRQYHNLFHLENMYSELKCVQHTISDWDTVLFALFYHDAVYSVTKKDNEEKSSKMAISRLREIGYDTVKTSFCYELIMATKHHASSSVNDINLFTDADLSILGKPWAEYEVYCLNVRKEYSIYPDLLYNPGRKKALQHFLEMEHIFKTPHFKDRFEAQARKNITQEIDRL
ncbi:hypothetical protein ACLI08_06640 [Flavobacterium sp. RNTU_13]|uniref:HD domain-containing protein n=1 Tax=Flavobacterium sp. RNTU_13 TaxID=3375145 RepID=UPI0039860007